MKIRISALRAIIDLLLLFGIQLLSEMFAQATQPAQSPDKLADNTAPAEEKGDVQEDTAQSILTMLSEFLDSEVRLNTNCTVSLDVSRRFALNDLCVKPQVV